MESINLSKNIKIFCFYRFVSRFYLYLPILAVILYKFGLSFVSIGFVLAMHGISLMIFKIPLGYIVKKVKSNKKIIFIGEIFKSIGVFGLGFSQGELYILLISQSLSGIGFALTTSTESSLLLDSMKEGGMENNYRSIEAKSQGYSFLSILISGIIGSIIAASNIAFPLYLTVPFSIIAAISILFFHESVNTPDLNSKVKNSDPQFDVSNGINGVLNLLLFYAVNRAIILTVFVFVLPIYLLKAFDINLIFFGAILSLFSLASILVATNFEKISNKFNDILWATVPVALLIAIAFLIQQNIYFLLAIPVLLGISAAIVRPLAMGKVNSIIKNDNNAVMSKAEQMFGFLNAMFLIIMGILFSHFSLDITLYVFLSSLIIVNVILILFNKKQQITVRKTIEDL